MRAEGVPEPKSAVFAEIFSGALAELIMELRRSNTRWNPGGATALTTSSVLTVNCRGPSGQEPIQANVEEYPAHE
jgi:hypothetical protein